MTIHRKDKGGRLWPAIREDGKFVLGDPKLGDRKHYTGNAVRTASETAAIALIREGYSIRVESPKRPSLVRLNLWVDGVAVT